MARSYGGEEGEKNIDYERHVAWAEQEVLETESIQMPWEGASMLDMVLGTEDFLNILSPPMRLTSVACRPTLAQRAPAAIAYLPQYRAKRRKIVSLVATAERDDTRAAALAKWLAILEANLHASQVGRQLVAFQERPGELKNVQDLLLDVFADKATNTLEARAIAMLLFMRWFADTATAEGPPVPLQEPVLYEYFCSLRATGAPATRASSLLEAWHFGVATLGFDDPSSAGASRRCRGAAHRMSLTKRARNRKDALRVAMVVALEYSAVFISDPVLRAQAGFACLLLYGRLRCSDGNLIAGCDGDDSFLEGTLLGTKTSKGKDKVSTFLPLVVPLHGLSGLDWWKEFEWTREHLGLPPLVSMQEAAARPVDAKKQLVLPALPRRQESAVSADEVSSALIDSLTECGFAEGLSNLASHSLKATWLTFAGMSGLPTSSRQLLGYHVVKGEDSALNYNRDNLSVPMDELVACISKVRTGAFVPDAKRGKRSVADPSARRTAPEQMEETLGMTRVELASHLAKEEFTKEKLESMGGWIAEYELRADVEKEVHEKNKSDSGSSTVDALSSSSESEAATQKVFETEKHINEQCIRAAAETAGCSEEPRTRSAPSSADVSRVFVHKTRGTAHFGKKDDATKLACGRLLSEAFEQGESEDVHWPRCNICMPEEGDLMQ